MNDLSSGGRFTKKDLSRSLVLDTFQLSKIAVKTLAFEDGSHMITAVNTNSLDTRYHPHTNVDTLLSDTDSTNLVSSGAVKTALDLIESQLNNTQTFWNDYSDTDYVQNQIGTIATGTTVSTLREAHPTVASLLGAMLNLAPAPSTTLVASGAALTFTNSVEPYPIGSSLTVIPTMQLDRGVWNPSATSPNPNPPPYGVVLAGSTLSSPFDGTTVTLQASLHTDSDRIITLTSVSAITTTFAALADYTLSSAMVQTTAGTEVYNNYNTPFSKSATTWSPSNTNTWRVYAPIYVNSSLGTPRCFYDTVVVYVADHVWSHQIDVPKQPTNLAVYDAFLGGAYYTQTLNETWSFAVTNDHAHLQYYRITWIGPARGSANLRITF